MKDQFRRAEDQYYALRGRLAAGWITREQFETALKQLMLQDSQGRYWMIGMESGGWYVYDGQRWVEAVPPIGSSLSPALPEARVSPRALPLIQTVRPVSPASPSPAGPKRFYIVLGLVLVLALVATILVVTLALQPTQTVVILPNDQNAPSPVGQATSPAGVTVASGTPAAYSATIVFTFQPPKLLQPQEFAATSDTLAQTIAELNRAQLKFIHDAQASSLNPNPRVPGLAGVLSFATDFLDDDLREVAAGAQSVAQNAETLAQSMAGQGGASDAALQTAAQYVSIARLGYGLVIEAQNLREGLLARTITRADAVNTIAEYGARLWNPAVADPDIPGNPFLPDMKDATTLAPALFLSDDAVAQVKSRNPSLWLATSSDMVTMTVSVPPPHMGVSNLLDPNLPQTLTTAGGQLDADRARQFAAFQIAALTASPLSVGSTPIQFAVFKSASIADSNQVAAGRAPSFAEGRANALSKQATGDAENLVSDLYTLNGQAPPRIIASTPVQSPKRVLTLNITGVNVEQVSPDPSGDWRVLVSLSLQWTASMEGLVNPQVDILCGQGVNTVYGSSGQAQMKGMGTTWSWDQEHAYVNCFSGINQKGSIGFVHGQARVLITLNKGTVTSVATLTVEPTDTITPTRTPTMTVTPNPTKTTSAQATQTLATSVAAQQTAAARGPALKGRIVIDYYKAQSSRKDAGAALSDETWRCVPDVTISLDGAVSGQCENKNARNNQGDPAYNYIMTVLVAGQANRQSGSFSFTYELTEISPRVPNADYATWRIIYSGSGKFTPAMAAAGTANFSYNCQVNSDVNPWCGWPAPAYLTSESFSGTVPWNFALTQ
ncbi:MAG: hypothetical protein WCF84_24625 [Anaerolineae bacterium]